MNCPHPPLRIVAAAAFFAAAGLCTGQGLPPAPPPPPIPPQQEGQPEIVPPPAGFAGEAEIEPEITIKRKDGETYEEARINGKLVWIKVTPRHGRPYFLVPDTVDGVYIRRDGLDPGLRVPLWVLFSW